MIPEISKYEAEKLWNIADLPKKQRVRALKGILRQIRQAAKENIKREKNRI